MNRFDESFVYLVDLLETQTQATLVLKHILMLPLEMASRDHIMEHILMLALRMAPRRRLGRDHMAARMRSIF